MSRITKGTFARYDQNLKWWHQNRLASKNALKNYQKSEKAGLVEIFPTPETDIQFTGEFICKESLPEGAKSSENPSSIHGRSSIRLHHASRNLLCKKYYYETTRNLYGITYTFDNWKIYLSGTSTISGNINHYLSSSQNDTELVLPSGTYRVFNGFLNGSKARVLSRVYIEDSAEDNYMYSGGVARSTYTFTSEKTMYDSYYVIYILRIYGGEFTDNTNISQWSPQKPMVIRVGDNTSDLSDDNWEPPSGEVYNIDFGKTYYGFIYNSATGVLTVTHEIVEPESLTVDITSNPADTENFEYIDTFGRTVTTTGNSLVLAQGSPVGGKIVYKLARPYTVNLSPIQITSLQQSNRYTPKMNTLFSNLDSIQASYQKSPIRAATEQEQAILALGGNI